VRPTSPARIEQDELYRLVGSATGHAGRLASFEVIQGRTDYAVIRARLDNPSLTVIVKLAGPNTPIGCPFDRTAAIMDLVRAQTPVPICEVLATDVSYRAWPWRYLITTYLEGRTWASARELLGEQNSRQLYGDLGRMVGLLHSIRFAAAGELLPSAEIDSGTPYHAALMARARRRIANPEHAGLFVTLLAERAELFADLAGATLCHEDLNPHNILLEERDGQWRVAAFLDFDSAWAGHGESDLARLQLWHGMTGPGFLPAYEAVLPIAPGYLARRPIYQLLWCLEYADPTPEHHADTAMVCAELGIAPVRFA
jgi:Phosphotransferase enzyme family